MNGNDQLYRPSDYLNIVVPMAGAGSRFSKAGYTDPKPLIKVNGVPMIQLVINNLRPLTPHRFIFICQQAHIDDYGLEEKFKKWAPECVVIGINGVTEGAACTVLVAKKYINNSDALMIANSDQYIDVDINDYLRHMTHNDLDGLIMTMKANDPKWSYVGLNDRHEVINVVEKEVISDEATVGIYNFKTGEEFVISAESMIAQNLRVNNEFYVAPVYNQLVEKRKNIGIYNIGSENQGMHGLGTPADLELFLTQQIHKKATKI